MSIYEKLAAVQAALKAPKGQYNSFGKYNYRSCEDIVESVKPLLKENGLLLTLSDEIILIGDRFYVKATADVIDIEGGGTVTVSAFAREEESKKGMDGSQVTGASSSYARKYALNGMFAIDDNKDSDTTNTGNGTGNSKEQKMETFEDAVGFVLTFGQYEGETIGDIWKKDFGYIRWLNGNEKTDPIVKKAIGIINEASRASRGNSNA